MHSKIAIFSSGSPTRILMVAKPDRTSSTSFRGRAQTRRPPPDRVAPRAERPRSSRWALHDDAAAALRQMIIENVLRAGDRIPEEQFCHQLGISRTPLREALKILAAEGLVEFRPNRGSVVASVRVDEIAEIFEVMSAFEELTGKLVCARISNVKIEQINQLHNQMAKAFRQGERAKYFALNQEIHRQIVLAAENPTLAASYGSFTERIQRARFQANYDSSRWEESMREHDAIMLALQARRAKELSRLLREHSAQTGRAVLAHLRKVGAQSSPSGKDTQT
ncbi:MAG: GntR family transcriptional regulator [Xanthobacteraceae bacterium]|nr:GntR family transcriptional regulator [Xanthobacteraceae bacterium]